MEDYQDLVRDDAVHRRAYVDPLIFDAEMERIFGRVWVYVAHESELPRPGDYKTVSIGRTPVIVTRDAAGELAVLVNRCTHRGLTVCQAGSGNASVFTCPYHGWSYDLSGKLTGVPFPSGYDDAFDRASRGLGRARVESYRGFIFASLDPAVQPLRSWLGGAIPYLDAFTDCSPTGQLDASLGAQRTWYKGNWKLQLEGAVDGYHPYVLHKAFFDYQSSLAGRRHDIYSRKESPVFVGDLGNGHMCIDTRDEFAKNNVYYERIRAAPGGPEVIADLEREHGAEETKRLLNASGGVGFNLAVFPNLVVIHAQIRVTHPVAVDRTAVEVRPPMLGGLPLRVNQLRIRAHELLHGPAGFVAPDDLEAFGRTQRGLAATSMEWMDFSRGLHRERHVDGRVYGEMTDETHVRGFYRQWRRWMGSQAPVEAVAR